MRQNNLLKKVAFALVLLMLVIVLVPGVEAEDQYYFATKWGIFGYPVGIATDQSGNVYVADDAIISKYKPDGSFITSFGYPSLEESEYYPVLNGIAINSQNFIYVVDYGGNKILKFTPDGIFISEWEITGSGPDSCGITSGPENTIYVAVEDNIQVYDSDGNLKKILYTGGSDALAVDPDGFVYAVSGGSVRKFTSDGVLVTTLTNNVQAITVDSSGNVFVVGNNAIIREYTSDGLFVESWGGSGSGDGQFYDIRAITSDSEGNIYVAEGYNWRVQKFSNVLTQNIVVTSDPSNFLIYLDGVNTNYYTPHTFKNVDPGTHTIKIIGGSYYRDQTKQVTVNAHSILNVSFIMEPILKIRLVAGDGSSRTYAPGDEFTYRIVVSNAYPLSNIDHSQSTVYVDPNMKITGFLDSTAPCWLSYEDTNMICGGMVYYEPQFKVTINKSTPVGTVLTTKAHFMMFYEDVTFLEASNTSTIVVSAPANVPEYPGSTFPVLFVTLFVGVVSWIYYKRIK